VESQVVPCGQTAMTKLTVAFRKFANAPKTAGVSKIKDMEEEKKEMLKKQAKK
jgi:hypothetical protein